jgi:flagellar M-ring protein FliF
LKRLISLWEALRPRQRALVAAGAVAAGLALYALVAWNRERGFEPLYMGLAPEDAGAVTAKLREANVDYRLRDGGATVLVKAGQVAEMRLRMAASGLPASGRLGFELFDQANFGASEFTEQVNYHRALEGELERSVMSLREVERARVHVTLPKESLYLEARQPAKASILVKLRPGARLSAANIAAVTHLAASAVPGLQAAQVTVLDTEGNLLNRPRAAGLDDGGPASEAVLEYRQAVERDAHAKAVATLEPLLGAEHFRVAVSAEFDPTSGEESEEIFDPSRSVMLSSQVSEDLPATAAGAGVPGTASNLPRATAAQAGAAAAVTNYGRRTESTTFQTSRRVRHTKLGQGRLKRLSLSVLVDHTLRYEQGQPVVEPPAPEKLQVIKELVAAAVGMDAARGDQLVVEAFPFEATLAAKPLALDVPAAGAEPRTAPEWLTRWAGGMRPAVLAAAGAGAALTAGAGGWWWWRRRKRRAGAHVQMGQQLPSPAAAAEREIQARLAEQQRQEAEAMLALKLPAVTTKKTDVLTKHIAAEVKKDPAAMAQVVRSWLHGEYQR